LHKTGHSAERAYVSLPPQNDFLERERSILIAFLADTGSLRKTVGP
jgi:hypothetical protein